VTFSLRDQLSLEGQVALITGAGNILGPEFAAALAEFGADLALADIDEDGRERVARNVRDSYGARALAMAVDIADEASVNRMVETVIAEYGRIDVLICAAATRSGFTKELHEYSLADWEHDMGVNLTGMFLSAKHVIPHFIEQKSGAIINIASIYGILGPDSRIYEGSLYMGQQISTPPTYAASKGGVVALTRYQATTLAQHGIRANSITPGGVFSGQNKAFVARYSYRVPMGRMANREELRGAVAFLASDASSYVTGHNLVVDGGLSAW
jgi:NAD(P)-dependent dehydrogenase (short-subunit alcohol dehydrogenase family)